MIDIEEAVNNKYPSFATQPALIRRPTISLLKRLVHENEINDFLALHQETFGVEFIDRVFEYFNFAYHVSIRDKANIPALGRVVIIANHPIGSLDGLAILHLVSEIRPDVKIVANDMLTQCAALAKFIVPVDNMTGGSSRRVYKKVLAALENEQAIILFPAGEVSRARPLGVRDTLWRPGFLHFARKSGAPVLPIHIQAKNSLLFYGASMLFKPFGTALLAREMFNKRSRTIHFNVGEPIVSSALQSENLHDRTLVKRLKKHLYQIGRRENPIFETEKTIAHPENCQHILQELQQAERVGNTRDGNHIYIFAYQEDSAVIREIGRLRELAFRKVGEGTGKARDLDEFDTYYRHLILWDCENLEIAGAYRLGEGKRILKARGMAGFYTSTLYDFHAEFIPYLEQAVELGRSFVNPKYWGKTSLDYLWQGIGAYVAHMGDVRYLIGPVSMSADYPRELMDQLVYFYRRYYSCPDTLASALHPYVLTARQVADFDLLYDSQEAENAFDFMQKNFIALGHKLPILYKQYTALFKPGGFQSIVFGVDPGFGDCLDGLCMTDLRLLKTAKKHRYFGKDFSI